MREWGDCLAEEPDYEGDKYKEFFELCWEIDRALIREWANEDIKKIPNSYLDTLIGYLEQVKLNILEQTTKSIVEVNQILYRNWCIAVIAILKKKLLESYKDTGEKRSRITRNKLQ